VILILFGKIEDKFVAEFLSLLESYFGESNGVVVKQLYAAFGDDLFLILSLFAGLSKVNFPSLRVLSRLQKRSSCYVLYREFHELGYTWVQVLDKVGGSLGLSADRVAKHLSEYGVTAESFRQKRIRRGVGV
jgi:hypothetical protein